MNDIADTIYQHICDTLRKDGKMDADGRLVSMPSNDLQRYCHEAAPQFIWDRTSAEVAALDVIVAEYQERFNIVGSVRKTFYKKAEDGKHYQYLTVEQAILQIEGKDVRFMDWLLARWRYAEFSEVLPEYFDWLEATHNYSAILEKLAEDVSEKFQS